MEGRFGADLSAVRVHTDDEAARAARALDAHAYTIGNHIVFGAGHASRGVVGGELLSHELAHVVQRQRGEIDDDVVLRAECSLTHLDRECGNAAASCATVGAECKTRYPKPSDIEAKWKEVEALATKEAGNIPNAAANLKHFLSASGSERTMPFELFRDHPATQRALAGEHRDRFAKGAIRRLESGSLRPGALSEEVVWTGTANAFALGVKDDLGLAVGGYTLCSKVRFRAKALGETRFEVTFDSWSVQAFDCYNWDPGKGIGFGGITDTDMCCFENAGRAKHFRVRTEPWVNSYAPSLAAITVTATLPSSARAPGTGPSTGPADAGPTPPPAGPSGGDRFSLER